MLAHRHVLVLPPSESVSSRVSLLSRNGTCCFLGFFPAPELFDRASAATQLPSAAMDLLIRFASSSRTPCATVSGVASGQAWRCACGRMML